MNVHMNPLWMNAHVNPLSMNAHVNLMWMNSHMELHCLLRNTLFMDHYKCLTTNPPSWSFEPVNLCCQKLKYLVASCIRVNPQASSANPSICHTPMKILNSIPSESPHQYSIPQWKFFHQTSSENSSIRHPSSVKVLPSLLPSPPTKQKNRNVPGELYEKAKRCSVKISICY